MSCLEFRHEAMATTFALFIDGHRPDYARQAATSAWSELERLESELSRYRESSDIARLNRLARGASTIIGDDTFQCLLLAAEVAFATDGAFDATYNSSTNPDHAPGAPRFTLDPATHTLTSLVEHLHVDLGAIGKGYAVDRLGEHLAEWDITTACLQSGGSTALALDAPVNTAGWTVGLDLHGTLPLVRAALSGSGIAVQGAHLIDPRTGAPATRTTRTWALAPTAALSDALSTAFFVWPDTAIASFCAAHPEIGAANLAANGTLVTHGSLTVAP